MLGRSKLIAAGLPRFWPNLQDALPISPDDGEFVLRLTSLWTFEQKWIEMEVEDDKILVDGEVICLVENIRLFLILLFLELHLQFTYYQGIRISAFWLESFFFVL